MLHKHKNDHPVCYGNPKMITLYVTQLNDKSVTRRRRYSHVYQYKVAPQIIENK